ncbi:MAG: transporter [Epsilonproteobacteria bacterium]|nr:transporter [Campylobacterota bacterium]
MISVISIYLFIILGFIAKRKFHTIDEKSFVIVSVYFLQPFLTFWGLTLKPIDITSSYVSLIYLLIIFVSLIFTIIIARGLDTKERNIAIITALIGNTGNLGIPLSYALWQDSGAFYATIINLTNVFFIYLFGIFFYAGKFNIQNIKKIFKIPIIYAGLFAIIINTIGIDVSKISQMLQMGAYSSMVLQLMIFGMYTANISIKTIPIKLSIVVSFEKFILVPVVGFVILKLLHIPPFLSKVILLEVSMPIAVNNVNLAALFDNAPEIVAWLIILSSVLFIPYFLIVF